MKLRIIKFEELPDSGKGVMSGDDILLTIEVIRGLIWRTTEERQVRSEYDPDYGVLDWYYYPEGEEVDDAMDKKLDAALEDYRDEEERKERVKRWSV